MKFNSFFIKLILFPLPLLLCAFYLNHRLAGVPNSYNTKRHNFEQQLDSIEVIALGDSHATYGINPAYFSHKGFTLANSSQDIYFNTAILTKYLPRLSKLKLVIIEADYISFNYSLAAYHEKWRTGFYYQFWQIKSDAWDKYDIANYSLLNLYMGGTVKAIVRKNFDTNLAANLNYNGWMKFDTLAPHAKMDDVTGQARVAEHDNAGLTSNTKIIGYLTTLLNELTRRNIKIAFVTTPAFSTYTKFCKPVTIQKNRNLIDSLCLKYGCSYTNYFTDSRFNARDYYNVDHLNFLGAEKLSKLIDTDVIKPLLN
jgi:hypothetical protein